MRYATVRRRAVAVILDLLIIAAIGSPVWLSGSLFTTSTVTTDGGTMVVPSGFVVSPWTGLLLGLLPVVYFATLEALYGATPGKMLLGLRVVKPDGAPIGWREAVVRNLLRYIDSLFAYLVAAISAWSSPLRQRLGDRAAQTVVIHLPATQVTRAQAPASQVPYAQVPPYAPMPYAPMPYAQAPVGQAPSGTVSGFERPVGAATEDR